ncbi:exosortase/archaeosortase family protein [Chlorobaculum sp. 24CR]|uniref:exosortase/archaeosortase family protein n=1 Tax=Chlorobaculum sp. 24CR TaxID=2508878 RepID=UPI00100C245F|nr:exosortase/archaeosortase family protein [Chlorobaculum sp. 24CR]RXK88041.1 exosortase/archaeosortase family protein [Chlorobaculum sp. 24CR]
MSKFKITPALFPWAILVYMYFHSVYQYVILKTSFSNSDQPLLFATVLVVCWIERKAVLVSIVQDGKAGYPLYGLATLIFGLIIYISGQLYPFIYFEIWGLFLMTSGFVMGFAPKDYIRSALFIGLAGTVFVVLGRVAPELLSSELAKGLASVTASIISAVLFPVTSNGVSLYFGPYSAEVAHACSGMNSIFSLFALSVLYLREGVQRKYWHIGVLILLVIPIAILTNLVRVMILVLMTWYFGNRYAQGIYHDATGIMVFIIALVLLAVIDKAMFVIDDKIK